jgi:DNA-binding NarL/FixJ family response regulator
VTSEPTPAAVGPPIRLLIVDDRPRTRRALRALLAAHAGFDVVGEASNGDEAMARVADLQPDVVLLDVRMPGMDGIAATAQMKSRWPAIRVVVHSMAIERRDEALAAGADAFVAKSVLPHELVRGLQQASSRDGAA